MTTRQERWERRVARREVARERIARRRGVAVLVVGPFVLLARHDARTVRAVLLLMALVAVLLLAGTPGGRRIRTRVATWLGVR